VRCARGVGGLQASLLSTTLMMVAATVLNERSLHVSYAPRYSTQLLSEAMAALGTSTYASLPLLP
jgi:hypothetical protein